MVRSKNSADSDKLQQAGLGETETAPGTLSESGLSLVTQLDSDCSLVTVTGLARASYWEVMKSYWYFSPRLKDEALTSHNVPLGLLTLTSNTRIIYLGLDFCQINLLEKCKVWNFSKLGFFFLGIFRFSCCKAAWSWNYMKYEFAERNLIQGWAEWGKPFSWAEPSTLGQQNSEGTDFFVSQTCVHTFENGLKIMISLTWNIENV